MPFINKYIRGRIDVNNIAATIPQIYFGSVLNLWKQIINDDLYSDLLLQDLPWELLPSGDFIIHNSTDFYKVNVKIASFYELPEPELCHGLSLLLTINKSIKRVLSASISTTLNTSILPSCSGRSILTTVSSSISEQLVGSINSNLSSEVL